MSNETKKTVADDMKSRVIFDSPEKAAEYLTALGSTLSDFGDYPLVAPGIDSEGNFDPAIYNENMSVMVATLKAQKGSAAYRGKPINAIVVAPVPKLDALLNDEAGRAWVEKIIQKEQNHVAVRELRTAADPLLVVESIPTTIEGYISTGREGGAGLMEAFNELYKPINAILTQKIAAWAKARLTKGELKKCCESRGYALEYFVGIEDRGEGKESLFVTAIKLMIAAAGKKGLDPTLLERWLATRNAKTFDVAEVEDEEEDDFDSLADALLTDDVEAAE